MSFPITVLTLALILATLNERLIEIFIKPMLVKYNLTDFTMLVSLVLGVLLALAFTVDFISPLLESFGDLVPLTPWAGIVVSGAVIGGGSNFVHDIIDMINGNGSE